MNHAFSTISTSGFSTRSANIAYYNSMWIEGIITVFMLLSGIHFGLLFATLTGKHNNIFRSEVTRFYLLTVFFAALFISISLWNSNIYATFGESVRYGLFQVAGVITTTGFSTANTTLWTPFTVVVLIYLMFQCACAGSTSGGLKSDRILLSLKVLKARLQQQQHPNAVIRIKLNGVMQENSVINAAMFFIVLYVMIVLVGTIVVTAAGMDMLSGFSMVAACMGNTGVGFGAVGSASDYSQIPPLLKSFCTILMLLGRLEIFGLIQLFMMKWWR